MPTIKLGSRPKSFARVVKFKDVDGTEQLAPVTYKYRTRKEYGAWLDTLPAQPTTKDATGEGGFSAEKYLEMISAWNASKIAQVLDGWGLEIEFNEAAVKQLCDEMPACAEAIIEEYRAAIVEGHLGN
jgi:hypothetical protein